MESRYHFYHVLKSEKIKVPAKLFIGDDGEIGINCDTPELSLYLQNQLRKIKGKEGIQTIMARDDASYKPIKAGFMIFPANTSLDCTTFYIRNTSICLPGQTDNTFRNLKQDILRNCSLDRDNQYIITDEIKAQLDELENEERIAREKISENRFYGSYCSLNEELSLGCPSIKGVEKVIKLFNLDKRYYEVFNCSIYFDESVLPFKKGSDKFIPLLIEAPKKMLEDYRSLSSSIDALENRIII